MKAPIENITDALTAKRIFARLEWEMIVQNNRVVLTADYFGIDLTVSYEVFNTTRSQQFSCILQIDGLVTSNIERTGLSQQATHKASVKIVGAINIYVRSRPFHIERYKRGLHRLLDPNGFDYIGEYVTLEEARRTCVGNY